MGGPFCFFFFLLWVGRIERLEVARTCIYDTNAQGYRTARCLHQYAILRKQCHGGARLYLWHG